MVSKNQIRFFSSLRNKKYREVHHKFLAEGEKIVTDILKSPLRHFKIDSLIATPEFLKENPPEIFLGIPEIIEADETLLGKISSLSTPNKAILVCRIPEYSPDFNAISRDLCLFLEDIRDPGNLGTIIRTADWFGVHFIFCTRESVDVYNPKVVQSTMGALCRVKVFYVETSFLLSEVRKIESFPIIGTLLEGKDIYKNVIPSRGMIVFGNESKGISKKLQQELDLQLTIPSYGDRSQSSESLNVASAAGIVIAEFRRRNISY